MTTEDVRNETLQEEAAPETQNHGGETMGEQTKQNQSTETKSSGKRNPYDGSKPHGVVPARLENVEAAAKAKDRLKLRLAFLNKEYAKCVAIIQDPDKSISDKAPAVTSAKKINEDLKKLQVVVNDLKDRIPELEELVKDSVENFNPATKVEVTI